MRVERDEKTLPGFVQKFSPRGYISSMMMDSQLNRNKGFASQMTDNETKIIIEEQDFGNYGGWTNIPLISKYRRYLGDNNLGFQIILGSLILNNFNDGDQLSIIIEAVPNKNFDWVHLPYDFQTDLSSLKNMNRFKFENKTGKKLGFHKNAKISKSNVPGFGVISKNYRKVGDFWDYNNDIPFTGINARSTNIIV